MIKLMELIAGKFDLKETLELLEVIFKHYRVKPKVRWDNSTKRFANYEVEINTMYVSKKLNKDPKEFLHTILHEIKHAIDAKKMGKNRYEKAYQLAGDIAVNKGKDFHDDNKFEEIAEKWAIKEYSKWKNKF